MSLKNKTVETYEEKKEKLINIILSVFPKNEEEMIKFNSLTIEEQVNFLFTETNKKLAQHPSSGENPDAFGFYG